VLATHARRVGAQAHSIDTNAELIAGVDAEVNSDGVVTFHSGTSLEMLPGILREVEKIDFAFLDSAPSAMTTWQEFALIEPFLKSGAIVVVDNACLPGEVATLSPCRKGKIVVPFLLASSWWEVEGHPQSGDSMVVAIRHGDPHYADPDFEGAWNDDWKKRVSDGR
jgi:predicted O-methyltransferase YrrM